MPDRVRYLLLRAAFGSCEWVCRRFTPAGRLAALAVALSAMVGLDTDVNLAYQAFTFLAALTALSMLWAVLFRPRLSVRRTLPRFGTAGTDLPYSVTVENAGARLLRGAGLSEDIPPSWPSFKEFSLAAEEGSRHWTDRAAGFSRWRSLLREKRIAQAETLELPDLAPGAGCEVEAKLSPSHRGRLKLPGFLAALPDPAGIFNAFSRVKAEEAVVILPKRYPVGRLALPGMRRYQQGGVSLSSAIGESMEFVSLRDYRPGDPIRRMHWKSAAKTGKLIVKECRDEYFVRHALALDTFIGDAGGRVFEEAVSVAASFACSVLTQESILDLLFVGAETFCVTAGRGLGGPERMLEVLSCVEPCRDKPFSELRSAVARRHASLSGCICVLLDIDEERRGFIRQLKALGAPVLAMAVSEGPRPSEDGIRVLQAGRIAQGLSALT
ncbi:MAG: DUF58 domain-containing protein [Elusimicrobia bacterium]|nr:DUF58 domain-containing protein [Elusimicrobiota bacterium]